MRILSRTDVFTLQATICPLTPAGFLFLLCLLNSLGFPWMAQSGHCCSALGSPVRNAERPRTSSDGASPRLLFVSSCGNIMIELLKTGLEIRHWWGQGDVFPFFSFLRGLHCGFVCGKPWFQTSLTQTQPDPNVRPWSEAEIGFLLHTSPTTTFRKSCSIDITIIACTVQISESSSCITSKAVALHLKDTGTTRDITCKTSASI